MIKKLINLVKEKFEATHIETFTYYIPSPPNRSSGYQEKQFDLLFSQFLSEGKKLISINTVPNSKADQSGMWIIALVKTRTSAKVNTQLQENEPQLDSSESLEIYKI